MYNENSFLSYISGLKVRRVFFMIVFSIIGALVGVLLSDFIVDVLMFGAFFRILIIVISTLLFFAMSLLLTINTAKDIQEGYWKVALLRKLTVISKKLDSLDNLNMNSLKSEFTELVEEELEISKSNKKQKKSKKASEPEVEEEISE